MLQAILGSQSAERVLMYIFTRGEGFAREMARFYDSGMSPLLKQLVKMERAGILAGRDVGRTRLYSFDPRYPFLDELKGLLSKALEFYPDSERAALLMVRKRPRRKGKPKTG